MEKECILLWIHQQMSLDEGRYLLPKTGKQQNMYIAFFADLEGGQK